MHAPSKESRPWLLSGCCSLLARSFKGQLRQSPSGSYESIHHQAPLTQKAPAPEKTTPEEGSRGEGREALRDGLNKSSLGTTVPSKALHRAFWGGVHDAAPNDGT